MDVDDLDVVVWPVSEEREVWWREIVGAGTDGLPARATGDRRVEDTPSEVLYAA